MEAVKVVERMESWPVAEVHPYPRNPRAHSEEEVRQLAAHILRHGFNKPIEVDEEGVILCGHRRLVAALVLGLTEVPVIQHRHLAAAQKAEYRIADNQLTLEGEWDAAALQAEFESITQAGGELRFTGFSEREIDEALAAFEREAFGAEEPPTPEPPDAPVSRHGDLWILGRHRLLCGDSASRADVDRLLVDAPIHLLNADPPYNVKVEPRSNNAIAAGLSSFIGTQHHQKFDLARYPAKAKPTTEKLRPKDRPLMNDFVSDEEFARLLRAWFGNAARVLLPGRGFYIWGGYGNLGNYPPALADCGLYFSQGIVWDKGHPVLTRKDFMGAFEICFYGWRAGAAHQFFGPNNATDLWQVKKINPQSMVHLTEKPVELAARAILYSSRPHENVLDLFGGSGSTLIGAEQTSRNAFLLEIDPPYVDVIVQRWQETTGQVATLEGDGRSFAELAAARGVAEPENAEA
jgi:DNA modification methylase